MGSLDVQRNQEKFVLLLAAGLRKAKRSAMTKHKQLFRMLPRNNVLLNLSVLASMSLNLYPNCLLLRSVWMYPRRSAPGPEPIQGRSRSQLSRNGATYLLKSLAWLKISENRIRNRK